MHNKILTKSNSLKVSTAGDMSKAYTTAEGFGKLSMPNNKQAIKEVKPSEIDKENEIAFP